MGTQVEMEPTPRPKREMPSWFRYLTKAIGSIAAPICAITGLVVCLTVSGKCLFAGVLQILIGCSVFILEAPCCCSFLDFVDKIGQFSDNRAPWQKGVLYAVFACVPVSLCPGVSTIIGCGVIFITAGCYGIQAVGPRAPSNTKAAAGNDSEGAGLVQNEQPPPVQFSGIV